EGDPGEVDEQQGMDEPSDEAPAAAEHERTEESREPAQPEPLGHQQVEGDARQQVVQQDGREEEMVGVVEVSPRVEEELEKHRRWVEDPGLDRGEGQRAREPEAVQDREGARADRLVDEDPPREVQLAVVGRKIRVAVREQLREDEGEQEDGGAEEVEEGGDRDQPRGDPVAEPARGDRHFFDRSICATVLFPVLTTYTLWVFESSAIPVGSAKGAFRTSVVHRRVSLPERSSRIT